MKKFLIYFGSAIVGLLLAYGVNQLPNLPDTLKPVTPIVLMILVVAGAWFTMQQSGGSDGTSFSRNKIIGSNNKAHGKDGARVDDNEIKGDGNEIGIDDGTTGSGRNP
jgi:hypothetical protein